MVVKNKFFVVVGLILSITVGYFFCQVYESFRRDSLMECLASLNRELDDSQPSIKMEMSQASTTTWINLTDVETVSVIRTVIGSKRVGCANLPSMQEGKDIWGNKIHVAIRLTNQGERRFMIRSDGDDGVSGTLDDIFTIENVGNPNIK